MRSGKLNLRIAVYRLPLNTFSPALVATVWGSLRIKPAGAVAAQTGLRSPDLVEIRLRQPLARRLCAVGWAAVSRLRIARPGRARHRMDRQRP